ncbi:MAG: efflux RND transporter periplasmic adaptor subunit [Kiritimatiellae bacterium]|nr:efflux RND transporter periplasmic adaptor subunit [Kiritimatiellia bacterium]MCO5068850.1 efflux RND transporter periplasmic adaptor subunit [Kiritimatiellia bacterium]
MSSEAWKKLSITEEKKRGAKRGPKAILLIIAAVFVALLVVFFKRGNAESDAATTEAATVSTVAEAPVEATATDGVALTVSGYVIPRERIEISPRFQGTVKWIGVKKGDRVKAGDVLARLEDDEYRARAADAEARVAKAEAGLELARSNFERAQTLRTKETSSEQELDDARQNLKAAQAELKAAEAALAQAKLYVEWCVIRAPITGVILEKLVNPNELVTPVSFGGSRGPSTAFLAMADLGDLQVEIDLNEVDTPKVRLGQACRISPEAYPDKRYEGVVAEIAPEANRAKGTLQIKVQIKEPDAFLTPELSARVDFLSDRPDAEPRN